MSPWLTGLCIVLIAVSACAAEESPQNAQNATAAAWLAQAEHAHEVATAAAEARQWDTARGALRAAIEAEVPSGVSAQDRRVVRQDLAYRLAEVELSAGAAEAAVRWAERGLEEGRGNDVFTANLLVIRGRANEAVGRDRPAANDYFEALEINEALLRRSLGEGEQPEPEGP